MSEDFFLYFRERSGKAEIFSVYRGEDGLQFASIEIKIACNERRLSVVHKKVAE